MGIKALLLEHMGQNLEQQWIKERHYTTHVVRGAKAEEAFPEFIARRGRPLPAGDGSVEPETVDEVIALLRRLVPASEALEAALGRLSARTVIESIPAPHTEFEHDLFDALTILFLGPLAPGHVREAVRTAVGETNLEFLLGFTAFIHAAHYWTETHSDLTYEADMLTLMAMAPRVCSASAGSSSNSPSSG
jgi:hypothetical protein